LLFRCLTGRSAFDGEDALGLLLKVLLEDPPRLRALREDAPPWLEDVVASLLSKSPDARPANGAAVAEALSGSSLRAPFHDGAEPATPLPASQAPLELTSHERRVLCLLLTMDRASGGELSGAAMQDDAGARALREIIGRHGGRAELLADRSLLAVFAGAGSAADLASRASRCALTIAPLLAGAPVVIVTGRAALAASMPVGELIDRAAALLGRAASS
jgi:hypothetical protein